MKYSALSNLTIIGKLNYLKKNYENSYMLIAEYILDYNEDYKTLTLKQIAQNTYVSITTVERFVKILGYTKFSDFKYNLIFELENNYSNKNTYNNLEYFQDLHTSLENTLNLIDDKILKCFASTITQVKNVVLIGIGSSYLIALDFSYKLERMGINSKAISDPNLIYFNSCLASKNDLFIGVTYSGKSKIINESLEQALTNGAMTCILTSEINRHVYLQHTYKLYVSAEDKLIRTNSSSARIVMLAYIDAIHTEILKSSKREEYLKNIEKTKLREY